MGSSNEREKGIITTWPNSSLPCPSRALAPELIAWRDKQPWPGQPVPQANLHLTLAFLGEADELTTRRLIAAVEHQHCPPLAIRLDETGWFSRARAAWIGPKEWPNELNVLARALRRPRRETAPWQWRAGLSPPCHPVAQVRRGTKRTACSRFFTAGGSVLPLPIHLDPGGRALRAARLLAAAGKSKRREEG